MRIMLAIDGHGGSECGAGDCLVLASADCIAHQPLARRSSLPLGGGSCTARPPAPNSSLRRLLRAITARPLRSILPNPHRRVLRMRRRVALALLHSSHPRDTPSRPVSAAVVAARRRRVVHDLLPVLIPLQRRQLLQQQLWDPRRDRLPRPGRGGRAPVQPDGLPLEEVRGPDRALQILLILRGRGGGPPDGGRRRRLLG